MKRLLKLLLLCVLGLLIGFFISNKDKMFSSNKKELNIKYDISRYIEVEKDKNIEVKTEFKSDKQLLINVSNTKESTIKIKFYVLNKSSKNDAKVSIKYKEDDSIYNIKIDKKEFTLEKNKNKQVEIEIILKDVSKIENDKLNISFSLIASPL